MGAPAEWVELLRTSAAPRAGVHVTDCLGCPRRKALLREGAPVDLARLERRLEGTILHSALAAVDPETAERPVAGHLWGVPVVGSVDRLTDGRVRDYKNPDGKSKPDGAYPEQVWQMEAYRYLLAKAGMATTGWTLHVRYKGQWLEFSHDGPVWTEDALGAFRPHGGDYTAEALAEWTKDVESGLKASSTPKAGASMRIGGKTSCEYCECQEACDALDVPRVDF